MTELTTFPEAYAAWLHAALDEVVDLTYPPAAGLVAVMGGMDYVRACTAWRRNCALHPRRRQNPPAPAVPGASATA